MTHTVKRSDLILGETYVVFQRIPGHSNCPATIAYFREQLIELRSGNRAVVQREIVQHNKPIGSRNRKVIKRMLLREISCSQILATATDWNERGATFDLKARHLVMNPPAPAVDNLAGQTEIGRAA